MNLNGIAQAYLERNHCRFFFFPFYLFSCDWCRKWKWKMGKSQGRRDLHVLLLLYSTTALLDHVVIWSR